jgi:hypothetical protein
MLKSLYNRIKLHFNPPKAGDTFYAHPAYFVICKPMEQILHGLKDKFGNSLYEPIPSNRCYRITIESDTMPDYYRCTAEVFCVQANAQFITNGGKWMPRCQPKRIGKSFLKSLLIDGKLEE